MTADPNMVVVTEASCGACGTPRVKLHHQSFPEMSTSDESPRRAAESLLLHLKSSLDAVSDPGHQEPVRGAIADVQAYLAKGVAAPPEPEDVIDIAAARQVRSKSPSSMLAKAETLEVRLLTLPAGREIPTHHAQGEITVHCLEGRIAFTSGEVTRNLTAGQLIILAAGEPHSLVSHEDSAVLVTKVLPTRSPALAATAKTSN